MVDIDEEVSSIITEKKILYIEWIKVGIRNEQVINRNLFFFVLENFCNETKYPITIPQTIWSGIEVKFLSIASDVISENVGSLNT